LGGLRRQRRHAARGRPDSAGGAPISHVGHVWTNDDDDSELPSWVNVGIKEGLPEDGAINLDNILTVELRHVKQLICQLSTTRMAQIDQAARFALALDSPPED
jgi:mRNA-degrading endonuclease toxin of MazEF toxin-antitoxin module